MSTVGPNIIQEETNRRLGIKKPGEILFGGRAAGTAPAHPASRPVGERADPSPELSLRSMPSLAKRSASRSSRSLSKGSR